MDSFYDYYTCEYEEKGHKYFLVNIETKERVKELKSVTRLLGDMGIAPNYAFANEEIVKMAAERGTLIHSEVQNYYEKGEIGFTQELYDCIELLKQNNLTVIDCERILFDENVAGRYDLSATADGKYTLLDVKTGKVLHKDSVKWQLSIYAYLYKKMYGLKIGSISALHLGTNSKLVPLEIESEEDVKNLIEADQRHIDFVKKCTLPQAEELYKIEERLAELKTQSKALETERDKFYTAIMSAMNIAGVKSFEDERLKITYVDEYLKDSFDIKKFREDDPLTAEKYTKTTTVKASIRVKIKEVKDEG